MTFSSDAAGDGADDPAARREAAEGALLRRLRGRQLSVREARTLLVGHDLDGEAVEQLVERFVDLGYLDDARLAEQLAHSERERKRSGRAVIGQTLSRRGLERSVVDAALEDLPDDDAERALEFARQKARSMGSLDRDVALRRLHGQLARRGFGGSVAMTAARQALDEAGVGRSGVRFR